MCRNQNLLVFPLIFMLLIGGLSSVSAKPPPAKIISGLVSNVASMVWKWLWSLQSTTTTTSTTKSAVSSRPMVKFESGYNVETVFDGRKHGIEPYAVEVSSNGELLVLDSENSNIHKISIPISRYGRPKLVSGSAEGYEGHVDGKLREATMNHPRGLAVDDRGNVYVADTNNMAIRKISDHGVSTIAGGKRGRGGHIDGPAEDAKFSDDFDIIYVAASCSILVIDRGNQAIREIQLHEADCSYNNNNEQDDGDFHLGTAILVAAGFFGYMLALLQRRVRSLFSSSPDDGRYLVKPNMPMAPYQRYPRPIRPTLIPPEHELENREEGFFGSFGKLIIKTISSVFELFFGLLFGYRRKPQNFQYHHQHLPQGPNQWPIQESFIIPKEDEPPALEPRSCIPEKPYVGTEQTNQIRSYYENQYQNQNQKQNLNNSKTNEQTCEKNEILFGAVQEQDGRRGAVMIRAVDFAGGPDAMNERQNLRPRINYMGYSSHIYS